MIRPDASMASRGSLALESISPNPLSAAAHHPPTKKRKACHNPEDWGCAQTISIRAHAASLSDEQQQQLFVLEPIAVVPRPRFPLTWLDGTAPSAASSKIQPGCLFVADVPALEAGGSSVLAVRLVSDGGLYIVERVKRGVYALSRLRGDVEEGDIFVAVKGWCPPALEREESVPVSEGGEWWEMARVEDPGVDETSSARWGRLDGSVSVAFGVEGSAEDVRMKDGSPLESMESRAQSLVPRLALERSSSHDVQVSGPVLDSQDGVVDGGVDIRAQSPQELLDNLREQYLQALYVSKTSVAYFAKGPLARCRAAFQSSESEDAKLADLIDFYREAVLNAKKMDLKYRETLPSTIQDAIITVSDEESTSKAKKTKSKKKKLGKNGLYPGEEQFVRRWWRDRALTDQGVSVEASREAEVKKNVADLRLRETQLQILLILETLALEAAAASEAKSNIENGDGPAAQTPENPKPKAKKLQNLNVMLELHIDRLCIWHAVSFDDTAVSDPTKATPLSGKKIESDAIRDFCTEVIIPFYASRLPDKCKSITRKLGVSSSPSKKQSQTKKASRPEPGSAVERQPSQKHPRRTLQRVLTDEQATSQGRQPSLNRSNTAPSHPDARRESIDPLLPALSSSVRGGIQKAKRAENREVDLNAVARQHETKLKKVQLLVDQKKELDAAIDALRKPNRELVAKDIAEDADKRRGRKPKNPVRNPLGQGVQVAATPKGSRKKDAVIGLPPLPRSLARSSTQPKGSLFGSDSSPQMVVPGSTIRHNSFSGMSSSKDAGMIQETPTRKPNKPIDPFDDAGTSIGESPGFSGNLFRMPRRPAPRPEMAPSTPVSSRHKDVLHRPGPPTEQTKSTTVMETPPRHGPTVPIICGPAVANTDKDPEPDPALEPTYKDTGKVLSTPIKGASRLGVPTKATPTIPVTPEKSIYESLGWDDDELGF